jgi:choline monooxygenase
MIGASALPLDEALALPAIYYTDPHWLGVEQRQIFARTWQLVGQCGDLVSTGDHIVADIAGLPILIIRDEADTLRGFHNVCRHRAGPIALCAGRGAKRLRCAYHGWIYDFNGRLRLAPEMSDACDFDTASIQLPEIFVQEWQGLVFACLYDPPDFAATCAGIVKRISPIDLSDLKFRNRITYEVASNWKVYVDNYLEGYHVPTIHPDLAQVVDYARYETEIHDWQVLQHSPVRNNEGVYGDGTMFYYWIYPNLMLNICAGRLQTNRVIPVGPDRCIVEFDYYYDPKATAIADGDQRFTDQIQAEDAAICAHVQKNLASGSYSIGRLCPPREAGVWKFQNLLRADYAAASA